MGVPGNLVCDFESRQDSSSEGKNGLAPLSYISVALFVMVHDPNASELLVQACNSFASRH